MGRQLSSDITMFFGWWQNTTLFFEEKTNKKKIRILNKKCGRVAVKHLSNSWDLHYFYVT